MEDRWVRIRGFPNYIINEYGDVENLITKRMLKQSITRGNVCVTLHKDGVQYRKSVALLMMRAWYGPPPQLHFDGVIHLDGDFNNCSAGNLMWRPTWFSRAYHKEIQEDPYLDWEGEFLLIETDEIFIHPRDCSTVYGYLQRDIAMSLANHTSVFPDRVRFKWI